MRTPNKLIAAAILAAGLAMPALAQSQEVTRVRGTIDTATDQTLAVKTRDGTISTITLKNPLTITTVKKAALTDIKAGTYIGTAATKGKDGKLVAMEVHIFPEAMRGAGEGNHPWDAGPDSAMVNATVGEVSGADGHNLKLTYKGGTADVVVPPDAPVVTFAPGDSSMMVKGAAVIVFAQKQPDGSLAASRMVVESGGVKPPM